MPISRITSSFILVVIIVCVSAETFAQYSQSLPPLPRQPVEIKLDHAALGKAPTVSVQIGKKTYPFLFDSGMGVTMITPDIAQELGCQPFGQLAAVNAGGERVNLQRCANSTLKIDSFTKSGETAVFNLMTFFSDKAPQIGGAVSLHTFEGQVLTMDLAKDRLWLESEESFRQRIAGMKELESRIARPGSGNIIDLFVAANTPKGKMWLLFDTGNFGWTHISPSALEMLETNLDAPNKAKTIKPILLDLVGIGPVEIPMRERNMIYDGQINYDTVARMVVTIDLRNGRVWAKLNN
jgi:predicted aspartyl protease